MEPQPPREPVLSQTGGSGGGSGGRDGQERALAAGAGAGTAAVDAVPSMDGTDPMAALVELVVARERAPEKHGKLDDARQCTFQPQLNANSRRSQTGSERVDTDAVGWFQAEKERVAAKKKKTAAAAGPSRPQPTVTGLGRGRRRHGGPAAFWSWEAG